MQCCLERIPSLFLSMSANATKPSNNKDSSIAVELR
jgi:hypothetical protein